MKLAAACLLALLAAPGLAHAESAVLVSRDVALADGRALAGANAAPRFDLVGLHWQGSGSVTFRTRSVGGRWSGWHPAAPEAEDRPDRLGPERSRAGWRLGNPYWTGPSDGIEYRLRGHVRRLRAHFVRSSPEPLIARRASIAGSPAIVPRLSWGANEQIRRAAPSYADALQFAVVHHTAGRNSYTRTESAAIVKAIQAYHVLGNGWNDIGYNFLVDKYGQVFEGRFGGMERNVVGAHAEGFNTGSVGVAVLGNYESATLSAPARKALADVIAWRLDLAHIDPLTTFNWISGGNAKFPRGAPVFLRSVIGHRDVGFTDCPGDRVYAQLGELAGAVSRTGLPKLYAPLARGGIGGPVRFTARLSAALPWTVTVSDSLGRVAGTGSGVGSAIDWLWDATAVASGTYSWSIASGDRLRAAAGTIGGKAAVLALTQVRANPAAVTPNADGRDDTTTISYTLNVPATVTARLFDVGGTVLTTLFAEPRAAGSQSFTFTADGVADGTYRIVLTAVSSTGRQVSASVFVLVNRSLSGYVVERPVFSPNADGRLDTLAFSFTLAAPAEVKLRILNGEGWVATPFSGSLAPGSQRVMWDGRKRIGRVLDGRYVAELTVTDVVGTVSQRLGFAADTTRPSLRLVSLRPLRLWLSEPAEIVLVTDGRRQAVRRARAGTFTVPLAGTPRRLRVVAWDAGGNTSRPLRRP